jgi:RNA polymerase sigma-70 factor (ECF subfamily)
MGDKEQADEIAQNTYKKLCRLKHNRDIGDLRNYLFNMAVRLAINVLRKRESVLGNIGGGSAYLALLDELRIEAMRESIAKLPDKTKYVFLLYCYRGCSYSTIASKLSISIRSVSNHIDRALENISYAVAEFSAMERRG